MIIDYFKIALNNLKQKKTRSILTLLGIFIAILTIFILLSLSLGLNDYVNEQFKMLGTDKFFIMPKGQAGAPGSGGAVELTTDDVKVVERVIGGKSVAYMTVGNAKIEFNSQSRYYMALGIPMDNLRAFEVIADSVNIKSDTGRILSKKDSGKIMIGYDYKYKNVFNKPINPGDNVIINGREFGVVGIVSKIGNPSDDKNVYMLFDDFKDLFNSGKRVDDMIVQVQSGSDIKQIADKTKTSLMRFRNVKEKTIDFTVLTPEELMSTFGIILNILTAFLVGIGSISLLVGGIGIANTMYTSVLERNKEIGTMKAIGARNSDILLIFVIESGFLGLIGGILGVIFGILISKSIEYISTAYIGSNIIRASLNPILIIGSLMFAFIIGVVSGLAPSYQASKLKPVDALRYE
jgi:putative ABC transport system permease protein